MSTRTLRLSLTTVAMLSIMTALALGVATFFGASLYPVRAIQQQERLLHRLPVEPGEPIVITDIKVNGQSVSFDQKFSADDDWMKSLVFSVKNRSDKLILLVSLWLRFSRPPDSSERTSATEMYYGNRDLAARKPTAQEQLVGLAAGQTVDIQLTSEQFKELQWFLSQTGYAPSIEKVDFMILRVLFEDDTMWTGGGIFLRDKANPGTWDRAKPSGLSKAGHLNSLISRKDPGRLNTPSRFQRPQATNVGYWSLRHPSMFKVDRLFSHASVAFTSRGRLQGL